MLAGVALLTDVVSQTPKEKINRQASKFPHLQYCTSIHFNDPPTFSCFTAQVLTGFFADKLEDHESVPFALQALVSLAKLPTFGSGESVKTYRA
jgi:hypothetical protein